MVLGAADRRSVLTEPSFVGRRAELAALTEALNDGRRGRGGVVLLDAESGGGKSRLIDEFTHRTEATNTWLMFGQGVDAAGQRPYQLLEGVTGAIKDAIATDHALRDRLRDALMDHGDAVVQAESVEGGHPASLANAK